VLTCVCVCVYVCVYAPQPDVPLTDMWLTDTEPRQGPVTYRFTETALYSDRSTYINMIDQCNSLMDLREHTDRSTATVLLPARSVTCDGVVCRPNKTQDSTSASYDVTTTSTAAAKPLDAKKAQEEEKKHILATYGKATAKIPSPPCNTGRTYQRLFPMKTRLFLQDLALFGRVGQCGMRIRGWD
jgi:hypothetical protein